MSSLKYIRFHLSYCRKEKIKYYIPREINDFEDYKYNPLNKYYHDMCSPYSINDTDITLSDRRNEFDKNNMSL